MSTGNARLGDTSALGMRRADYRKCAPGFIIALGESFDSILRAGTVRAWIEADPYRKRAYEKALAANRAHVGTGRARPGRRLG